MGHLGLTEHKGAFLSLPSTVSRPRLAGVAQLLGGFFLQADGATTQRLTLLRRILGQDESLLVFSWSSAFPKSPGPVSRVALVAPQRPLKTCSVFHSWQRVCCARTLPF